MPALMWFRRDLRLHDHPALDAAAQDGPVTALFVLDDALRRPSGAPRLAFLYRALRGLDHDLAEHGGRLLVRHGKPERVVPAVAAEVEATSVHISADFGPYGAARDTRVAQALGDVTLVPTGSPYAVAPGRVVKDDGDPYRVYTPFYRAWLKHGWRTPALTDAASIDWTSHLADTIPADPRLPKGLVLPEATEEAARTAWQAYRKAALSQYADVRDRPDLDRTSHMSVFLKYGLVHPRTLLADLAERDEVYRKELAWREFYASILHFFPTTAREYYQPRLAELEYDTGPAADARLVAWQEGQTGYPIVDAGMRQMLAEGWMHNRVRMIVASFLVKDLHLEWTQGARWFMRHLVDGDLASNNHGWQWTAGSGTDASPYYRVFNPITQGLKFDPDGDYVRRWVPELREVTGPAIHEPWTLADPPAKYPAPIVDHSVERTEALARYDKIRTS